MLIPNLPGRGVPTDVSWLAGSIPDAELDELQASEPNPEAQTAFGIQARNLARLNDEGMTIAMGTDGNTHWASHVEMEDMVAAGMTPAEVLVAATRNGADLLGLTDMGTIEAGKSADFHRARGKPARRHHQHAPDRVRVSARRGGRPLTSGRAGMRLCVKRSV